jgi:hypothetical protein
MDSSSQSTRQGSAGSRVIPRRFRLGGPWLAVILVFTMGLGVTACASADGAPAGGGSPAASHAAAGHWDAAAANAAWEKRPDYVRRADERTKAAYAYALERPDVIEWLPCYCGCAPLGHRSNLDCFYQPREKGMPVTFEQHGAYCGVCIDTALMAKEMIAQGKSLLQVRLSVDREFSHLAPGTPTELPPA